jgi:uncharacterized membrane protein
MMKKKLNQLGSVGWIIGASAVILFIASSLRHALFQSTALDLAAFDQWVYLVSQGLPPISSFFGFHVLGDHAAFILYGIALLYKIYPDVHWLFAVQAISLAMGALPIYAISLQIGLCVPYARVFALSYLLYPALFNINFFTDFRPEAIAVPALLWAMWAGMSGRIWQLIVAVILALICKDSLSLTVIALGVWLWLIPRRFLYGIGCIVVGIVWYLVTVSYLVPLLREGQAGGVVFYKSLGGSPSQIIWTILTNPGLILAKFFVPDTLFYYLLLTLPVIIGLHWRETLTILPALPMLLLNIISDYGAQRDLIHHYSLPIFPFIIVWLVRSVRLYQQQKKRRWLQPRILLAWALIIFVALAKYEFFVTRFLSSIPNLSSLYTAVHLVKTQGSVLTTSKIAPHLSQRQIIQITSPNLEILPTSNNTFDYVLLDLLNQNQNNKLEFSSDLVPQLQNNLAYKLEYEHDNVYLFKKR